LIKIFTYRFYFVAIVSLLYTSLNAQQKITTQVLVIGGGASGVSAAIQSGRMGVKTIVAEPTTWLGGMITSAGVAAFDGNHNMPSGIFGEFRNQLYKVYGGPSKVSTGWVSNTLFEPRVGDSIFKKLVTNIPSINVLYHLQLVSVIKEKNIIKGATFINKQTKKLTTIYAKQIIDATELGDVMAKAGVPYDLGMEASNISSENVGVTETNNIIQDITYTAILKDYGIGKDCTITKPAGYDPMEFDGACTNYYIDKKRKAPNVDAQKMLNYGKLPNNKYMINWPGYGNDIYLNLVEMDESSREKELIKAKEQTLRFVYFIQQQLGFKNLGFADDEFPTKDRFPLIPYNREGRRLKGIVRFNITHIADPFNGTMHLNRTGISVGDYPIDHHHTKNPDAPQHLDFYPVPSFNIPLGALIPPSFTGLIVAEKGISVSNVVNGTTRLQPSVLLIGQAAGTLAALSVKQNKNAAAISVRAVQTALLSSGAYIMPYFDVPLSHPHFLIAQRIGATDILKGKGLPHNWANQTFFYPDSLVNNYVLAKDLQSVYNQQFVMSGQNLMLTDAINIIIQLSTLKIKNINKTFWKFSNKEVFTKQISNESVKWNIGLLDNIKPLTRIQFAKLLDATINPFNQMDVDHQGFFKQTY
jgi:hypothetical protein